MTVIKIFLRNNVIHLSIEQSRTIKVVIAAAIHKGTPLLASRGCDGKIFPCPPTRDGPIIGIGIGIG